MTCSERLPRLLHKKEMTGNIASQQASVRSATARALLPQQFSVRMMVALSTVLIVAGSIPVGLYFSGDFDALPGKIGNHAVPVFLGFRQEVSAVDRRQLMAAIKQARSQSRS